MKIPTLKKPFSFSVYKEKCNKLTNLVFHVVISKNFESFSFYKKLAPLRYLLRTGGNASFYVMKYSTEA